MKRMEEKVERSVCDLYCSYQQIKETTFILFSRPAVSQQQLFLVSSPTQLRPFWPVFRAAAAAADIEKADALKPHEVTEKKTETEAEETQKSTDCLPK
ncbi:hypothetical protein JOQ06_016542 [Pogonophryne albipinna]|uniref:Uncharacterized protein n=1 Tax=Pogonophryne albipinna TaxID=1090488 RepID=A0AAD6F522_9TELE|nr:hypothetical protein JOQ06_016542 [Pogonophryne albipinna]